MKKTILAGILAVVFVSPSVLAVDGVVLINQSIVNGAGGFPYTISQPGSYKLSGNLTVPNANTTAIQISADNVSLDLNGFSILGPTVCSGTPGAGCSPTGTGFGVAASGHRGISVENGTVRGMGSGGIALGIDGRVEKVHVDSNGQFGIAATGGIVRDSRATNNNFPGINMDKGIISGNVVTGNGFHGIVAVCPSSIVGNMSNNNVFDNIFLSGGVGCTLANNAAP